MTPIYIWLTIALLVALLVLLNLRSLYKARKAVAELESYKNRIDRRVERIGLDAHNAMLKAHAIPERVEKRLDKRLDKLTKVSKSLATRMIAVETKIKKTHD